MYPLEWMIWFCIILSYIVNHSGKICFCHFRKGAFELIHWWVALLETFVIFEQGKQFPLD